MNNNELLQKLNEEMQRHQNEQKKLLTQAQNTIIDILKKKSWSFRVENSNGTKISKEQLKEMALQQGPELTFFYNNDRSEMVATMEQLFCSPVEIWLNKTTGEVKMRIVTLLGNKQVERIATLDDGRTYYTSRCIVPATEENILEIFAALA